MLFSLNWKILTFLDFFLNLLISQQLQRYQSRYLIETFFRTKFYFPKKFHIVAEFLNYHHRFFRSNQILFSATTTLHVVLSFFKNFVLNSKIQEGSGGGGGSGEHTFNDRIFLVIDLSIRLVSGTRCFSASSSRLDVIRPGGSGVSGQGLVVRLAVMDFPYSGGKEINDPWKGLSLLQKPREFSDHYERTSSSPNLDHRR